MSDVLTPNQVVFITPELGAILVASGRFGNIDNNVP